MKELARKLFYSPRFRKMAHRTGGMMHHRAYQRIHDALIQSPYGDVVEVGGAAGSGGIAVAWALQERCIGEKVIVVEKCEGGSRARRGDYGTNRDTLEKNFRDHGVEDVVRLYPHALTLENGAEVDALIQTSQIGALIHDADGRLDRDFALFWPRLADGGIIVVDDYGPELECKTRKDGSREYVCKRLLTYIMLNKLRDWGLFEETGRFNSVIFGCKPAGADFSRFDAAFLAEMAQEIKNLTRRLNGKPVKETDA